MFVQVEDWTGLKYTYDNIPEGVVFTDVDGVLCSHIIYNNDGKIARAYNGVDGHGVYLLREAGYVVVALSGNSDASIWNRCSDLEIPFYYTKDKLESAQKFISLFPSLPPMYAIGNDVIDRQLLDFVNFSACPFDAHPSIRGSADKICNRPGGDGAFREFADIILAKYKNL